MLLVGKKRIANENDFVVVALRRIWKTQSWNAYHCPFTGCEGHYNERILKFHVTSSRVVIMPRFELSSIFVYVNETRSVNIGTSEFGDRTCRVFRTDRTYQARVLILAYHIGLTGRRQQLV